jgi:glyoxylase-like metal-dependent hydrolase (beta-lactamase superfamily II)
VNTLAAGISYFDLNFDGRSRVIATAVIHGTGGIALIDPGPSSTLPRLRQTLKDAGIEISDLTALVLTHIHLDHAGSSGTLVAEQPRLRVFVHERGAPHLINPDKLVSSASRLYGDDMERLWGEIRPVPASSLVVLAGGERIEAGGRQLDVAYTPGHASHHVSFYNADTGIAFVGDTAGVKLKPDGYVLPPTPPPDIDLEAWRDSLLRIEAWRPDTLFLTHFGPSSPYEPHLAELRDHIDLTAGLVKTSLALEGDDHAREEWFREQLNQEFQRKAGEDGRAYEAAARFDLNWRGLARYWRKKTTVSPT